jgi:transcriptional regulator GlxA family with amidase domain
VEDKFLLLIYEAIEKQLDNPEFDVDALATAVMTSRRTLYRKLATLTGLTPNEAIHSYRLLRATQLLTSGYSVSEVAYTVGFESPSYFGHCFKQQYQTTPSEYQQRHMAQS